ncbi:PAS domain-containing protein [Mycobacterium sp. DL592]|uniref:PAS domain-containing protein n=1 Tax=Mycobacterium sp. DL592 TaxID=2675524 RepID=UPI00141DAC4B|nr:PAS domain-containing protein [Mycobacterium sp. DL592]
MNHDWLLVETLGSEPVVVAQGRQMKNLVPITAFLRRNPHLAAIQTAISETVSTGTSLASITPKSDRVIRTEAVQMTDGKVHGVHVWIGPADAEPPERPIPGPLKWDMTTGEATDTVESLTNAGMDPSEERTHGRAFVEDLPSRDLNRDEARVLALAVDPGPGRTYCTSWDFTDKLGGRRRVGFVARTAMEPAEDGTEHLIARAMNLVGELDPSDAPTDLLAQRILKGLSQPGVYRAIVDLGSWNLLKWLDDPCPHYDWRQGVQFHPADKGLLEPMAKEFESGSTSRVLRLPGVEEGWVPMHVSVNRVELDNGIFAGLITLRLPTDIELSEAKLLSADDIAK